MSRMTHYWGAMAASGVDTGHGRCGSEVGPVASCGLANGIPGVGDILISG